jgi:hypothetical protein
LVYLIGAYTRFVPFLPLPFPGYCHSLSSRPFVPTTVSSLEPALMAISCALVLKPMLWCTG